MTPAHPDFEALSAHVDGEAPEWADHVAGCPECRATAAELRALANAVAAPVAPPAAAERERAVAAALGADLGRRRVAPGDGDELAARRRRRRQPWAVPAVAAVIIAVLGFSGLVLSGNRSPDDETTTLAGPGLQSDKADTASGAAESGVATAAPSAPVADLGDVRDAATLQGRAGLGGALARTGDAPAAASSGASAGANAQPSPTTNTGNTPPAAASGGAGGAATVQTPTTTLNQRAAAPNVVGTRPCEEQARARDATLGPVSYLATARQGQVQAFVLGFAPAPGRAGPSITLLMLAQDGCAELLRTTVP